MSRTNQQSSSDLFCYGPTYEHLGSCCGPIAETMENCIDPESQGLSYFNFCKYLLISKLPAASCCPAIRCFQGFQALCLVYSWCCTVDYGDGYYSDNEYYYAGDVGVTIKDYVYPRDSSSLRVSTCFFVNNCLCVGCIPLGFSIASTSLFFLTAGLSAAAAPIVLPSACIVDCCIGRSPITGIFWRSQQHDASTALNATTASSSSHAPQSYGSNEHKADSKQPQLQAVLFSDTPSEPLIPASETPKIITTDGTYATDKNSAIELAPAAITMTE